MHITLHSCELIIFQVALHWTEECRLCVLNYKLHGTQVHLPEAESLPGQPEIAHLAQHMSTEQGEEAALHILHK